MSHVRQQIRDYVAAQLTNTATVYKTRVHQIDPSALPVLLVYTGSETVEGQFDLLQRTLQIVIEAIVAGVTFDAALDDLLVSIETALNGDLNGLVASLAPSSIEITGSAEGSQPYGRARIVFEAVYRTAYEDPTTAI